MRAIMLIFLAAASRLLPHPDNFTPVIAMAVIGGTFLQDRRMSYFIPLAAMLASDIVLGFHSTMLYVYFAVALSVFIGSNTGKSMFGVLHGALWSSVLFFIVTNFGYWASNGFMFGPAGLALTYVDGIPFFRNELCSTVLYSILMYSAIKYEKTLKYFSVLIK